MLLLGLLAALFLALPAEAATTTVTLGQSGPSPATVTVKVGDTVIFSNTDSVDHTLKATSAGWTAAGKVTPGKKVQTTFTTAGTFTYSDTYTNAILGFGQTAEGSVVVPAQPTPSATPKPTAKPSTTSRPTSAPTAPGTTPTPVATGTGAPQLPPIVGGQIPTPVATASSGPPPQVAGPDASATSGPSGAPAAAVDYDDPSSLVQGTNRGFGLPTALAVVGIVGVATLLVRLLLAQPEADLQ